MDNSEKLKQGKQAALNVGLWGLGLTLVISISVGLFFAESDNMLERRSYFIIAAIGFLVTAYIVFQILTRDIEMHHYRENLRAEKEAERVEAEIAELNARRALYAAKERAVYAPLPGRSQARLPEAPERAIYNNGALVTDEEDEPQAEPEPQALTQTRVNQWRLAEPTPQAQEEPAPARSARGQTVITESAAAYELRLARLAREIYDLCRDVNPATQGLIKERIPLTKGGLLRSNDDITKALNILAARRLIEPSKGQGIERFWLDENGKPLPRSPKVKPIVVNVPVTR